VDGEIKTVSLADYKGKYVVLFWCARPPARPPAAGSSALSKAPAHSPRRYPKDFTFVCPTEIIAFSDRAKEFEKLNCQVGASRPPLPAKQRQQLCCLCCQLLPNRQQLRDASELPRQGTPRYVAPCLERQARPASRCRPPAAQLIAASTDTPEVHQAWIRTPRKRGGLGYMQIPILADVTKASRGRRELACSTRVLRARLQIPSPLPACQPRLRTPTQPPTHPAASAAQEIAARYGVLKRDAGIALRGTYLINPEVCPSLPSQCPSAALPWAWPRARCAPRLHAAGPAQPRLLCRRCQSLLR
jgi:peroxiredoxin